MQGLAAILLAESLLESERAGDAAAAARVHRAAVIGARGYEAAARDPAMTRDLLARAMTIYYARRSAAGQATQPDAAEQQLRLALLQSAQNARLVEQNDRIIQLLETIAAHGR